MATNLGLGFTSWLSSEKPRSSRSTVRLALSLFTFHVARISDSIFFACRVETTYRYIMVLILAWPTYELYNAIRHMSAQGGTARMIARMSIGIIVLCSCVLLALNGRGNPQIQKHIETLLFPAYATLWFTV